MGVPKLIYIEWCDAIESQANWQSLEVIKYWAKTDNWIVRECGFLLEENKEYILLANRISNPEEDQPQYAGIMKIPSTWIKKKVELTEFISSS